MLGDFASRRLAPEWVEACDRWLSAGIDASQRQLGEGWTAAYVSAPVWHFAWAPGVIDTHWWFGVLMPSSDSVGRYFPLVVAQSRPAPPADRFSLDHLELWWRYVGDAALRTLTTDARLETFEDDLLEAPPWPITMPAPTVHVAPSPGRERVSLDRVAPLDDFLHGLATMSLLQRLSGCSVWLPHAVANAATSCTVAKGLPAPDAFSALFTGQW